MANTDPLDDFFKKIDRKSNKHKKQAALLTNNEELHKQLVIVTSATTAFKENMDLDEEDDELGIQSVVPPPPTEVIHPIDDSQGIPTTNNKSKSTNKLSVQDNNNNYNDQQMAGDEWEEFEDSNSKYDKLRLKLARPMNDGDDDDEIYSDDENHLNQDQIDGNENRRRDQQDKPVWKLEQIQQTSNNEQTTENRVEQTTINEPVKPATTGAYRPPQLRSYSGVTIVSGTSQRTSKKEKPNLASTEEFPTLGAGLQKK